MFEPLSNYFQESAALSKVSIRKMSPEAVLSEDQKQIRFRKLLHKRRINAQTESSSSSTDFRCKQEPVEYEDHPIPNEVKQISEYLGNIKSESDLFVPIQKPFSGQNVSVPSVAQDSDFVTRVLLNIRKNRVLLNIRKNRVLLNIRKNRVLLNIRKNLGSIAEEIHRAFREAKAECRTSSRLFQKLVSFQRAEITAKITRQDLQDSIRELTEMFQYFASYQRYVFFCFI